MLTFESKNDLVHEVVDANTIFVHIFGILVLFDELTRVDIDICTPFVNLIKLFRPHLINNLLDCIMDLILRLVVLLV